MSVRRVVPVVVVLGALALAGCGGEASTSDDSTADGPTSSAPPRPAPSGADGGRHGSHHDEPQDHGSSGGSGGGSGGDAPEAPVPPALDFSATEVSGAGFDARTLAGTDTVFWFWAPWCTECAAAAEEVQAAAEANPDVSFVGVAGLSSDVSSMEVFVDEHGLSFPQLADADGSVYTRFGITQQDTYVLVSADGSVETVDAYASDVAAQELVDGAFG